MRRAGHLSRRTSKRPEGKKVNGHLFDQSRPIDSEKSVNGGQKVEMSSR
jgi:hypothetical protein